MLLQSTALDLLARDGLRRVNADAIANHAHAGKAAIYRRWPDVTHLIVDALRTCELVPRTSDTGALHTDLEALLGPWTQPLSRCENAAASLMGHPDQQSAFNLVLEECLVQPLAEATAAIFDRHKARVDPSTRLRLLQLVVQSLWWQRYTGAPQPLSGAEVAALVEQVLIPIVKSN